MAEPAILTCGELGAAPLAALFARFGVSVNWVAPTASIPGSWFGEPEAGIIGRQLWVRADTPVHSALHEGCHLICLDPIRRARLHTDAGGDYAEENAVNYLQSLLADHLPGVGRQRLWADMDAWGYTFRLGSAQAWFEGDAADARQWLREHDLIDAQDRPRWRLRGP